MNFPEEHIQYLVEKLPEKLLHAIVSAETYEIFKQIGQDFGLTAVQFDRLTTIFNYLILGLLEDEYLSLEIQQGLGIDQYTAEKISGILVEKIYRDIRIEVSKFKLRISNNEESFGVNHPSVEPPQDTEPHTISKEKLLDEIESPKPASESNNIGNLKSYRNYSVEEKTIDLDNLS